MPFSIIREDITKLSADAIVNAANNQLQPGGGVCGAIFAAAGREKLSKACRKIGYVKTGKAVITKGYCLAANYIIHTAGPIWQGGTHGEERQLYNCYWNSLELARTYGLFHIAFPLISSGVCGYPKQRAIAVAICAIGDFLQEHELQVTLVVYDREAFALSLGLYEEIEAYIDDCYVNQNQMERSIGASVSERRLLEESKLEPMAGDGSEEFNCFDWMEMDRSRTDGLTDVEKGTKDKARDRSREPKRAKESFARSVPQGKSKQRAFRTNMKNTPATNEFVEANLENALKALDESFSQCLLRLIDEKGMSDVEAYKKANVDRKLFSKIRKNVGYRPKKTTAIAFAIALGLSVPETNALLGKAGYILSHSSKFDIIIEYFILHKNYNIMEINEALFAFDQMLLGG